MNTQCNECGALVPSHNPGCKTVEWLKRRPDPIAKLKADELSRLRARVQELEEANLVFNEHADNAEERCDTLRAELATLHASALKQHNEAIEMAAEVCEMRSIPQGGRLTDKNIEAAECCIAIRSLLRPIGQAPLHDGDTNIYPK